MDKLIGMLQKFVSAIFWLVGAAGIVWLFAGSALAAVSEPPAEPECDRVAIGEYEVSLAGPAGFQRVDGTSPEADAFMESLKTLFKLNVLAVYADPDQWRIFVNGLASGQPRLIPSVAVVSSTTRMESKSYDLKGVAKERRHLNNMISLAINTRPLARLMNNRANAKLREKLGQDLGFRYNVGPGIGRYAETERSVSFALVTSLSLNGLRTESFVSATALNVGDKFIYLTWFNPDSSPAGIDGLKTRSLAWIMELAGLNKQAT
ncbi:MAG: hypothetical protein LBO05_14255 [Deltaproteobacteria bacterium]|jgi:hypothetical protein|nr:hypothetical protein [Deltaproteobacteria bacterium]